MAGSSDRDLDEISRQRNDTKRTSLAGLASALALLLFVAVLSYLGWQRYYNSAAETRQLTQQLLALITVLRDVETAQSMQRAYLLTGNRQYAEQAQQTVAQIPTQLALTNTVDNPLAQQMSTFRAQVMQLVADIHTSSPSQDVGAGGRQIDPATVARIDRDVLLSARLRSAAAAIQNTLQAALAEHRTNNRIYSRWAQLSASVGCLGVFAILLASNVHIRRLLNARDFLNNRLVTTNEDLQQFIFSASHDLQEPLRTLRIFSDSLESKLKASRPVDRELFHLRTAAEQMSALIADLLTYTEVTTQSTEVHELANTQRVVRAVLRDLADLIAESGAQINVESLSPLPISIAHAAQLFHNLIANALRFRDADRVPMVVIKNSHANREWTVSVQDNGIGIPPEYHQHIFGIFRRLHTRAEYPGTGLGLAICKKIVERYGGRLWVESVPGQGSTFFFTLPDLEERNSPWLPLSRRPTLPA